jgi:hypothetical protein
MIDREHDLPISRQAKVLNISRGSVYYKPRPVSPEDLALMRRIDELHLERPFAGARMLRDFLNREGVEIGRRHVATLMKRMGIEAIYRRRNPSLQIENVDDGCDLLTLSAGATVPPKAENGYTYTYNLLTFDWFSDGDRLLVKVMPRAWSEDAKHFRADEVRLGSHEPTNRLASPNFRRGAPCVVAAVVLPISELQDTTAPSLGAEDDKGPQASQMEAQVTDAFQLVILKFFRDLTPAQRLTVLVELNALPADLNESLSLSMERHVVNSLARAGRLAELDRSIQKIQSQTFTSTGGRE